jgi:glycerophosphoryl diester phosphodiesterase
METDVRATADGVVVALHDAKLDRVADRGGSLHKMTWDQVRPSKLADGRGLPLLEDLLGAWPHLRWNIDVKRRDATLPLVEVIKRTGAADRVLVASFAGRRAARALTALGPDLATGAGTWAVVRLVTARFVGFWPFASAAVAAQVPPKRYGIRIVDAPFIDRCHRAGISVHAWTINTSAEMERLLDVGVDGIMTDRPSVLKEVLERRGQWA